ncbi:DUF3329 domain-containing protein [Cardiobacteriaceae bacterium TAE3-ERU3]|nr:DUF3329 domain-containing protein [Cardiobacteriaceae bacterium TAE3-ERU3]
MAIFAIYIILPGLFWLFGALFDLPYWGLVAGLIVTLIWQHCQQMKLVKWVREGAKRAPPEMFAPLDEVASFLIKRRKQSRKRKRKLQDLLSRLNELAKAVPDAAMIVDAQGRLLNFNHAAQRLLGLTPAMDKGTRIDHLIRGESFAKFWHDEESSGAVTIRLPGDLAIYIELSRVPLSQGNKLLIARDVTNLVLLNQKRKAFTDNASHELKTPLTVISGFLEVMESHPDLAPSLAMPVKEMRSHAERMRELIKDMLQLASLEQQQVPLKESLVSVDDLFAELQRSANQRFSNGVGVVYRSAPFHMWVDEQLIYSALNNLITNALLHAHSRHSIVLDAMVSSDGIELTVSDDGIGMAAEHLPRITERFYRIDGQRGAVSGSGLGLAIVRHAVEALGGTLTVHSVEEQGSTFCIQLPYSRYRSQADIDEASLKKEELSS